MNVCGNYAKHHWTRAARAKDNVCVRCGLPFSDRGEALFESPPQAKAGLPNAKTPKNRISPLKQVAVKGLSTRSGTTDRSRCFRSISDI